MTDKDGLLGCLGVSTAMGLCACVGAVAGVGVGYIIGNVVDYIPLFNLVAPTLSEWVGYAPSPDANENFFQLSTGVSGFYGGLWIVPQLLVSEE